MSVLTRGVEAEFMALLASGRPFHPVTLVWLDWQDDPVFIHTSVGQIAFDGETWTGPADAGEISYPGEAAGIAVEKVTLTWHGATEALLEQADGLQRSREGAIYVGATTERAGNVLIGEPTEVYAGFFDSCMTAFRPDGDKGDIAVDLKLDLSSGPSARAVTSIVHSYEDQIGKFPGDTIGRHLVEIRKRVSTLRR